MAKRWLIFRNSMRQQILHTYYRYVRTRREEISLWGCPLLPAVLYYFMAPAHLDSALLILSKRKLFLMAHTSVNSSVLWVFSHSLFEFYKTEVNRVLFLKMLWLIDRRYLSFALYLFNTILKMLMYTCSKLVVQAVRPHFFRKASKCSYQRYFLRLYPVPGPSWILSGHVLLEGLKKENTSAIHLGNSTRKILRLNIWTLWPRIFF